MKKTDALSNEIIFDKENECVIAGESRLDFHTILDLACAILEAKGTLAPGSTVHQFGECLRQTRSTDSHIDDDSEFIHFSPT